MALTHSPFSPQRHRAICPFSSSSYTCARHQTRTTHKEREERNNNSSSADTDSEHVPSVVVEQRETASYTARVWPRRIARQCKAPRQQTQTTARPPCDTGNHRALARPATAPWKRDAGRLDSGPIGLSAAFPPSSSPAPLALLRVCALCATSAPHPLLTCLGKSSAEQKAQFVVGVGKQPPFSLLLSLSLFNCACGRTAGRCQKTLPSICTVGYAAAGADGAHRRPGGRNRISERRDRLEQARKVNVCV